MPLGPLPNVANVVRVKATGEYQTQPFVGLWFWHYNGSPPTGAQLQTFLASWEAQMVFNLQASLTTAVHLSNIEGWDLSDRGGAVATVNSTFIGTRAGTPLPVNCAVVSSWRVNYRWRGGHPRTYWPAGITTDLTNGHIISETYRATFELALRNWHTAIDALLMGGTGGHMTAVRYIHTPVQGQPPVYLDPPLDLQIQTVEVGNRLDSQRRRLGRETAV